MADSLGSALATPVTPTAAAAGAQKEKQKAEESLQADTERRSRRWAQQSVHEAS